MGKAELTEEQRARVTLDTPLRLEIAARIAFPDGSMTASGLRREGKRGRLVVERIAGKDFTTLSSIEDMRKLCRLPPDPKHHVEPARNDDAYGEIALRAALLNVAGRKAGVPSKRPREK
jgi:hypothetical protein